MVITKTDFKVIYNKLKNTSSSMNEKYIRNLQLNNKTGDYSVDSVISKYDNSYINKIINKIYNKTQTGGSKSILNDLFTETETNEYAITKVNIVDLIDKSSFTNLMGGGLYNVSEEEKVESSEEPFIRNNTILDETSSEMPTGMPNTTDLSATSDVRDGDMFMINNTITNETSSEMPNEMPNTTELSATSDVFVKNNTMLDETSSEIPNTTDLSATSDENILNTTTDIPNEMPVENINLNIPDLTMTDTELNSDKSMLEKLLG